MKNKIIKINIFNKMKRAAIGLESIVSIFNVIGVMIMIFAIAAIIRSNTSLALNSRNQEQFNEINYIYSKILPDHYKIDLDKIDWSDFDRINDVGVKIELKKTSDLRCYNSFQKDYFDSFDKIYEINERFYNINYPKTSFKKYFFDSFKRPVLVYYQNCTFVADMYFSYLFKVEK